MNDAVIDELAPLIEPDTGVEIVDTDVPAEVEDGTVVQGLTVARAQGRDDLWSTTRRRRLTYCLDRASFGSRAGTVERAVADATADWERTANVQFVYLSSEDAACSRSNTNVVFNLRRVTGRWYLARAFFPSSPRSVREILVDSTGLSPPSPLTLTGVLRHELGHVLGLRHEHTRSRTNPCYEDSAWRAITPYDVRSVMHYPQCAGVTGRDLTLSTRDRQGIALLYP